jgi:hypothetical protein
MAKAGTAQTKRMSSTLPKLLLIVLMSIAAKKPAIILIPSTLEIMEL